MPENLLNKLINNPTQKEIFIKWLSSDLSKNNEEFEKIFNCNVGLIDFIVYFLNFIHKSIPCTNGEPPKNKIATPKKIEIVAPHTNTEIRYNSFKQNVFIPPKYMQNEENVDFKKSPIDSFNTSKFSTPKKSTSNRSDYENRSFDNSNSTCLSPISPSYQNQCNLIPINKKTTTGRQQFPSLCLGDFIVENSKHNKKKKCDTNISTSAETKENSRRIKPTSINPRKLSNEFRNNSFNFQQNTNQQVLLDSVEEQRNLIVEERMKILSKPEVLQKTFPDLLKKQNGIKTNSIKPLLNQITFKEQLDCVAEIYFTILNRNLILNVTSEIYFLISILIRRENECVDATEVVDKELSANSLELNGQQNKSNISNSQILESLHNRVYFAVRCLVSQFYIIKFYDKTTLRILAQNERLAEFSPTFSQELINWANKKSEIQCQDVTTPATQTVCFNMDTDNQNQFTDHFNFRAFQRQRDLFYEIIKIWEENHLISQRNCIGKLSYNINLLFSYSSGPVNYVHLARLFKNQLLNSCAKGPKEKGMSEKSISSTISLSIDEDKLNLLTNRLVTKQSSNGINSRPVFAGYQEFFKDFILAASNYIFNKHLCDVLIADIIELNNTKFSGIDLNGADDEIDVNTRKEYTECIKKLRILAKFLGFVESLPYKSDDNQSIPQNVLQEQIQIRSKYTPPLDIQTILQKSIAENSLILSIPWITKYLAMFDYTTLRLPYFMTFNYYLFSIYRKAHTINISYSWAVIKFSLSWLFEMPHFPDMEYFNFHLKETKSQCERFFNPSQVAGLDYSDIINQSVLYICCPYLEEIKKLLIIDSTNNKIAIKYITPVTAIGSTGELSSKKLEQQLEEIFFNSHPSSLKKTIEFVSERVASSAVKYICYDMVPKAKEKAFIDCKEKLFANDSNKQYADLKHRKIALQKQAAAQSKQYFLDFLQTCNREINEISQKKIPPAIDSLLPIDALDELKSTSINITNRMYMERVKQWMSGHVTQEIFVKYFDSEIQKRLNRKQFDKEKIPTAIPDGGYKCEHNENTLSAFHIYNNIREACCDIIDRSSNITEDFIMKLLIDCRSCLTERNDLNELITVNICTTLFELCLFLVSNYPEFFNDDLLILDTISSIWLEKSLSASEYFKYLFCPRNIKILQKSNNKNETWTVYAQIISYFVEKKFIEEDSLALQCTEFYRRDWDEDILANFSTFLKKFLNYNRKNSVSESGLLLKFFSDFCADL